MAFGKEVASFAMQSTSMTKGTDSAGNHTFDMNMEGTVSGAWSGTILLTMIGTTADFQNGTYTADNAAYLDDGTVLIGSQPRAYSIWPVVPTMAKFSRLPENHFPERRKTRCGGFSFDRRSDTAISDRQRVVDQRIPLGTEPFAVTDLWIVPGLGTSMGTCSR